MSDFRSDAAATSEWVAGYLERVRAYPVLAQVQPGDIRAALPPSPPEQGEPFAAVLRDLDEILLPGVTHWQHPRYFAYFGITASEPAILAELVAAGLVTSDAFAGLRSITSSNRPSRGDSAGRWSALPDRRPTFAADAIEAFAWALLRRYGIVVRRLLARETSAVPWRDLARIYRRLEASGEIRGGRFVSGLSGEQFALPEAVELLRKLRRQGPRAEVSVIPADPLNFQSILTPATPVPKPAPEPVLIG